MNSQSHDGLTQALGLRLNRRWLGAATLTGAVAAALRGSGIRAQTEEKTCTFDLDATVVAGPNTGLSFQGSLTLPIGADGAIDEGEFVPANGLTSAVVGMATNRRLRLRVDLGDEGTLALSGTAQRIVSGCRGELSGVFGGPKPGDLGTWSITRQSQESPSGVSPTPTGAAEATRTPCPPIDCGSGTFVLDPETCQCGCPEPYDRCGDLCCPGGSVCLDASSGTCQCPQGTEICNEVCVNSCHQGQFMDDQACACSAGCQPVQCPEGQTQDLITCQCVPQNNGCAPGFAECGGVCIGITTDPLNCGSCGHACPAGVPCIGGTCMCPFGYTVCPSGCSDLTEAFNCGACGFMCNQGIFCTQGVCCSPSGIFAQCSFDSDCCSGACYHDSVANVTYCI